VSFSTVRDRLVPELFADRAVPVSTATLVLGEGVAAIAELDPKRLRRKLSHGGSPPHSSRYSPSNL